MNHAAGRRPERCCIHHDFLSLRPEAPRQGSSRSFRAGAGRAGRLRPRHLLRRRASAGDGLLREERPAGEGARGPRVRAPRRGELQPRSADDDRCARSGGGSPPRPRSSSATAWETAGERTGPRSRWPGSRRSTAFRSRSSSATSAQAAARDASNAPRATAPASAAAPFSPHFILGSLVLTLTLGATTGMINLLRIAAGAEVPVSHRQIHGHAQVLGFAALFLMGIAYHALPRILGIGGLRPSSARPAFWLMFSGVILRNAGQPLGFYPIGRVLSLLSSVFEAASVVLFARFVFELLAPSARREIRSVRSDPAVRPGRHDLFRRRDSLQRGAGGLARRPRGDGAAGLADRALLFRRALRVPPGLDLRVRKPRRVALPGPRARRAADTRDHAVASHRVRSRVPGVVAARAPAFARRSRCATRGWPSRRCPPSSISRATAFSGAVPPFR